MLTGTISAICSRGDGNCGEIQPNGGAPIPFRQQDTRDGLTGHPKELTPSLLGTRVTYSRNPRTGWAERVQFT